MKQTRHKWINITRFHLCEVLKRSQVHQEAGMPGSGWGTEVQGQGCGNGEFLLNGNRVSLWEDVKVLEVDGSGGCKAM